VHAAGVLAQELEPDVAGWTTGRIEREEVHPRSPALGAGRIHEPAFDQALTDMEDEGLLGIRCYQHRNILWEFLEEDARSRPATGHILLKGMTE
jgi:hypothetical protein